MQITELILCGVDIGYIAHPQLVSITDNEFFDKIWILKIDMVGVGGVPRFAGRDDEFVNVLRKPIYVNVAEASAPQEFHIQPEETILLEPGKYFISFQIVDCNEEALRAYLATPEDERDHSKMRLSSNIYLKSSYIRKAALGKMEHMPVNIGMVVKGLEYQ